MHKKYLFPLIVIILSVLAYAGGFWFRNLRGAGPAFSKPSENIAEIIDEHNKKEELPQQPPKPGANTTGFPLKLPDGFSISVFARNLTNARVMSLDPKGRLLVSQPSKGIVVALANTNSEPAADQAINILTGLSQPHGLAFNNNKLYVAETNQVAVYDYDADKPAATNKKKIVDLPSGGGHFTRTIMIKDGRLLISVGSSCNVCNESDWRRASILSANLDGSDLKTYASGLRNSVFLTVGPRNQVWATDMGRDLLGDNIPPDEVNIVEEGKNYGWPVCYDDNIHDTNFDKNVYIQDPCNDKTKPKIKLQAHSAPLGLAFIPKEGWPKDFQGDLLIAYHGSWNRSVPTGYKITRWKLDDQGNVEGSEDFLTGWLTGVKAGDALGRPVDLLIKSGVLYISDDKAGVIYSVTYK